MLTELAHAQVRRALHSGETAIDATAGNGWDTLFLAETVGPEGTVFAFDTQPTAIERTRQLLADRSIENVQLLPVGHEQMLDSVPAELRREVGAVMFNLGYLPGGDKSFTTQPPTTVSALRQALALLRPGGITTILAYPGHPRGAAETDAVESLIQHLPAETFAIEEHAGLPGRSASPRLFVVKRRTPP